MSLTAVTVTDNRLLWQEATAMQNLPPWNSSSLLLEDVMVGTDVNEDGYIDYSERWTVVKVPGNETNLLKAMLPWMTYS